jgi:hypothetical protein
MSYTQEQIDRANQVNLEKFLLSQGEQLIKSGNEYRWEKHDSLTVKGNKWFRHSQNKGGYPIDFVMEFFEKTFPEAVQMLIGENVAEMTVEPVQRSEFRLPPRCESNTRIIKYLTGERKLPLDLLEAFIADGLRMQITTMSYLSEKMKRALRDMHIAEKRQKSSEWMCQVLINLTLSVTEEKETNCLYLKHQSIYCHTLRCIRQDGRNAVIFLLVVFRQRHWSVFSLNAQILRTFLLPWTMMKPEIVPQRNWQN